MESKIRKRKRLYTLKQDNPQVAFRLDKKIIRILDRECKKQIITRSHFVRQVILKELTKIEEEKKLT